MHVSSLIEAIADALKLKGGARVEFEICSEADGRIVAEIRALSAVYVAFYDARTSEVLLYLRAELDEMLKHSIPKHVKEASDVPASKKVATGKPSRRQAKKGT